MILIAPHDRPQVYTPPLNGVAHPLAPQIVAALGKHGRQPVSFWRIVNTLANQQDAESRAHRRSWRLRFLCAIRELTRAGVLFRLGLLISTSDFAVTPKPKRARSLSRPVEALARGFHGSRATEASAAMPANGRQASDRQLFSPTKVKPTTTEAKQSAPPSPSQVSAAASTLAKRPRKVKRPWTGFLAGKRVKRGTLVKVPTGEVLPVYVVLRGKVLVTLPDEPRFADRVFDRYDASQVERVQLPAAQLLGATKPRPGSRPRGRPSNRAVQGVCWPVTPSNES